MSMFYDGNETLTHNALFNFIVGNRGAGKTYWSTGWAIKDFLKTGKQFVYVRRYDTEFENGKKEQFFDAIKEQFPDNELKVKGYKAYIDGEICGHFLALSKAKIEKSTSFPNVNKIIFDEFVLDKGNYYYLPDEVTNFLDLYETVARARQDVRVFFLSNAITVTNPYFLFFNILLNGQKRFNKFKNGDILVEMVQNEDFIKMKKQTRFGKLISGTSYSQYAIDNKFLRDNNDFLGKKTGKSRHYFTLKYNGNDYGIWKDSSVGRYFVSKDLDPSCKMVYSITLDDHTPNTMLLKGGKSLILKGFIDNYKLGNVYFESMNLKNITYEIIRLSLI